MGLNEKFQKVGLKLPEILLPAKSVDLQKWAVIACDQYSSEPEYWKGVANIAGQAPSTLNMIFPECYLEDGDDKNRIQNINKTMENYLKEDILTSFGESFILIRRTTLDSPERWGLIAALDLEAYDFSKDSHSLIRATEGTILDRIPPRKEIRKDALLEFPHIMVLLNDPEGLCLEPLRKKAAGLKKIYDFELMLDSGHLTGYHVTETADLENLAEGLLSLLNKENSENPMLFAMGDGNHSLATAKSIWEDVKKNLSPVELETHPARFALVELVNLFDNGIVFEPIHRVLFNIPPTEALESLLNATGGSFSPLKSLSTISEKVSADPACPVIGVLGEGINGIIALKPENNLLPTGIVQDWIDSFLIKTKNARVDYIHGMDSTGALAGKPGNMGILLPPIEKGKFFDTVKNRGVFPRKTFSMGEAREKRFYLESRKIK